MDPSELDDQGLPIASPGALPYGLQFGKGLAKGVGQTALATLQAPFDIWDAAYHPDTSSLTQGLGAVAGDPVGAGKAVASSLYQGVTGGPESLGETAGSFITPTDLAAGLSALKTAGQAGRSEIWASRGSPLYDTERGAIARAMKERGGYTDREIYDATFNPEHGGGYYMPPASHQPEGAAPNPWFWVSDKEAGLQPGTMNEIRAEAQRQMAGGAVDRVPQPGRTNETEREFLEMRGERGSLPRTQYTLSDFMSPEWKGFQAYPGLRDIPVTLSPFSNAYGEYRPKRGTMDFGGIYGSRAPRQTSDELLNSMLHESSHAVQNFERMPAGSSPEAMTKLHQALSWGLSPEEGTTVPRTLVPEDQARLRTAQEALETHGGVGMAAMHSPNYGAYMNVAGEANANLPGTVRNVESQRLRDTLAQGLPASVAPQVYPFEHYGDIPTSGGGVTGLVNPDPSTHLVTGKGGRLVDPTLGERVHLENAGLTGQLNRPSPTVNLARGQMRDQLALALRRAPRARQGSALPP